MTIEREREYKEVCSMYLQKAGDELIFSTESEELPAARSSSSGWLCIIVIDDRLLLYTKNLPLRFSFPELSQARIFFVLLVEEFLIWPEPVGESLTDNTGTNGNGHGEDDNEPE